MPLLPPLVGRARAGRQDLLEDADRSLHLLLCADGDPAVGLLVGREVASDHDTSLATGVAEGRNGTVDVDEDEVGLRVGRL